ncbi:hypothetical protein FQR65_LT16114 [Abscondita terminalis]|nr:hypothetical protein FQR65_LT16114 [Abscondita terminalis]
MEDFENFSNEEKIESGKVIHDKWKHIRDAFANSRKKRSGDKRTKKYIYFEQMQFLLKVLEKDDTESSISENTTEKEQVSDEAAVSEQTPRDSCAPKRRKVTSIDERDKAILKALEATYQPPPTQTDEDTAFFMSVTPAVKNFTEDGKIEFRMGVLKLIKGIKSKRSSSNNEVYPSYPSTSAYSTPASDEYREDYTCFQNL